MAAITLSGGPIPGRIITFMPVGAWTDPHVGDLVIMDTSIDYGVDEAQNAEDPFGIVRSVSPDSTTLGIEVFSNGCIARLPYDGAVALGNQVTADLTAGAGTVEAGGAVGVIIGIGLVAGYVDVYFA